MKSEKLNIDWFVDARFGMFVHFGLFSMLARGEWVMNKERIAPEEYSKLAKEFDPVNFDADNVCYLAKEMGMKYIVFTTMHHEGFRMYNTDLTNYCSTKTYLFLQAFFLFLVSLPAVCDLYIPPMELRLTSLHMVDLLKPIFFAISSYDFSCKDISI